MAGKGLHFARLEWKNMTASRIIWIALIAIAIIPALYGFLYLMAFEDPYQNLDTVPVAVVNEDKGAVIDGDERNLGDEVVDKIRKNTDGLLWNFVDADEAQKGIEEGRYFMACTIPSDFSANIASADTSDPKKAQLDIDYNESENLLASQIGETVWKEVRTEVSNAVAEEYWTTVLTSMSDAGANIQTAADGAQDLAEGLASAQDGSTEITDNLGTLNEGAQSLLDGLSDLSNGTLSLKDGAQALLKGTVTLQNDGTEKIAEATSQLAEATSSLPSSASQLYDGSSQITAGLENAIESIGSADAPGQTLAYTSNTVTQGIETLGSGLEDAKAGADQIQGGLNALGSSLDSAQDGASSLESALVIAIGSMKSSSDPSMQYVAAQLQSAYDAADSHAISNGLSEMSGAV
ncbi:MAG: YhgE/Pip family protein, partial [Eggerthellaceae bacterium]|nr:YhgE/Pip family protein [Eggerthellaceae bacterium]